MLGKSFRKYSIRMTQASDSDFVLEMIERKEVVLLWRLGITDQAKQVATIELIKKEVVNIDPRKIPDFIDLFLSTKQIKPAVLQAENKSHWEILTVTDSPVITRETHPQKQNKEIRKKKQQTNESMVSYARR